MKKILLISIILLNLSQFGFSQSDTVKTQISLEKSSIQIGDQIKLFVDVDFPKNYRIDWSNIKDSLDEKIEVLNDFEFDTLKSTFENHLKLRKTLLITSFDSGNYIIKPIQIHYFSSENDTLGKIAESGIDSLMVNTIQIDPSKDIKDIKGIEDEPFNWKEWLPTIYKIIAIIVLLIIGLFIYFRWKQKKPILGFLQAKPKPAHEIAFSKLKELEEKKLWQNGDYKSYYSELTDIFRTYIEGRMNFPAMERLTDEIIEELRNLHFDENTISIVDKVLKTADSVKFAKAQPFSDENANAWQVVYNFVDSTKQVNDESKEKEERI